MKPVRALLPVFVASLCLLVPTSQALAGPVGEPVPSYALDPPVNDPGNCGNADIAYSGTDSSGEVLAVWLQPRDGTENGAIVRAALVGVDGELTSTPVDVSVEQSSRSFSTCYGNPSVTAGPDGEFLVLWGHEDPVTYDEKIAGQIIAADGTRSGTNFLVSDWLVDIRDAQAAWSPDDNRYLVSLDEESGSEHNLGYFIDRDGASIGSQFQLVPEPSPGWPDVAYGSGVWMPTAMNCADSCYGPFGVTVDDSATPSTEFQIPDPIQFGATLGNSIAYNEFTDEFLSVWANCSDGLCSHYARRITSAGVPTGSLITLDDTTNGPRPRVASGGEDGYLVTWTNWIGTYNHVVAAQLGTDGQPVAAPEPVALSSEVATSYRPQVTYAKDTGCYVLAWNGNGNAANPFTTPTNGANVWTRNWNPSGSDPCVEPSPTTPTVTGKGKAGATKLRVKVECGGDAPCEIRLSGKQKGRKGKLVPKTVQVGANGKVVTLRYTGALKRSLLSRGGGKVRVTASQTDGGSGTTTVLVRVSPSPVTG